MLLGATRLVYCGTGWYLVILGQNRAVLVASVICFQKIYGLQVVNNQIIQYSEKETVITDKSTDRQNFLSKTRPLLWKGLSKKLPANAAFPQYGIFRCFLGFYLKTGKPD